MLVQTVSYEKQSNNIVVKPMMVLKWDLSSTDSAVGVHYGVGWRR